MWSGVESTPPPLQSPRTYLDKQTRENRDTRDTVQTETPELSQRVSEGRDGADVYIMHQPFLISNNPSLKAASAVSRVDGPAALQTLPKLQRS